MKKLEKTIFSEDVFHFPFRMLKKFILPNSTKTSKFMDFRYYKKVWYVPLLSQKYYAFSRACRIFVTVQLGFLLTFFTTLFERCGSGIFDRVDIKVRNYN